MIADKNASNSKNRVDFNWKLWEKCWVYCYKYLYIIKRESFNISLNKINENKWK